MEDSGAAPIAAVGSSLGETAAAASLAGLPPPPRNAGPPTEAAVAVQDGAGLSQRSIRLSRRASISLQPGPRFARPAGASSALLISDPTRATASKSSVWSCRRPRQSAHPAAQMRRTTAAAAVHPAAVSSRARRSAEASNRKSVVYGKRGEL